MKKFIIIKEPAPIWVGPLIPIIAVVVTFIITAVFVIIAGANPFEAYYQSLIAPLSNKVSAIEVLVKSTPIIMTGIAVTVAFSAGYWNIGAEGQLLAGAIAAAGIGMVADKLPPYIAIPCMILGGFLAGMGWAFLPAYLKVKHAVDEVVTTLLMNTIILFFISFLLNGVWRDPISGWPQSPTIADSAVFPTILPRSRLHIGFILAVIVVILIWYLLTQTAFGLRMRAIGLGKDAAQFAGVKVSRTMFIAAMLSGGIAGLAGVGEVAGIHFHLIEAISSGLGYTGIVVATLGGINPIGSGIAALFIGLIDTGAQTVSRALGVPPYLGDIVQSTLLLVTLSMLLLRNYHIKRI
jgi:ABC-type uncharacterized transport system permease subunit